MELWKLLCKEVQTELEKLNELEPGTEEHRLAVESVTKLADRAIEIEKIDIENDFKRKQMIDSRIDTILKHTLTVVEIGVPIVTALIITGVSLRFEETGSWTNMPGKKAINYLLSFGK